jgi:zinc D-Ala-D-Ala carboxypeptidase
MVKNFAENILRFFAGIVMEFFTWKRGEHRKLGKFFVTFDFTCQCGVCEEQKISKNLVYMLDQLRLAYGGPIVVTSGYRCEARQKELFKRIKGAARFSQHTLGTAADIKGKDMAALYQESLKIFLAVGKANFFIHVDLRNDKVRRWDYA